MGPKREYVCVYGPIKVHLQSFLDHIHLFATFRSSNFRTSVVSTFVFETGIVCLEEVVPPAPIKC